MRFAYGLRTIVQQTLPKRAAVSINCRIKQPFNVLQEFTRYVRDAVQFGRNVPKLRVEPDVLLSSTEDGISRFSRNVVLFSTLNFTASQTEDRIIYSHRHKNLKCH